MYCHCLHRAAVDAYGFPEHFYQCLYKFPLHNLKFLKQGQSARTNTETSADQLQKSETKQNEHEKTEETERKLCETETAGETSKQEDNGKTEETDEPPAKVSGCPTYLGMVGRFHSDNPHF